jgi:hypothetical protein
MHKRNIPLLIYLLVSVASIQPYLHEYKMYEFELVA